MPSPREGLAWCSNERGIVFVFLNFRHEIFEERIVEQIVLLIVDPIYDFGHGTHGFTASFDPVMSARGAAEDTQDHRFAGSRRAHARVGTFVSQHLWLVTFQTRGLRIGLSIRDLRLMPPF